MVDNYLPGFEMKDQVAKLPIKKTEENLLRIVEVIRGHKKYKPTPSMTDKMATSII